MERIYIGVTIVCLLLTAALAGSVSHVSAHTPEDAGFEVIDSDHDHSGHTHDVQTEPASVATLAEPLSGVPCDDTVGFAGPYPCKNVDLMAFLPTNTLAAGGTGADIWGWTDPETGKEYAVQSHSGTTSFVDISVPSAPVLLGTLPAPEANVLWRDVKVYDNHAYIVGDGNLSGPHGLQIFDLTQLRDVVVPPVVFKETAHYDGIGRAHNIAINEETGVGYVVGSTTCEGGLHMIGLDNPTDPEFLGCFSEDEYTHDVQCVIYRGPDVAYQGREICFAANEDMLTIVDVTDKTAPTILGRKTYEGVEYSHQGWLTEDHTYFVLGDELDELNNGHNTRTYLWDVSDLDDPIHFSTYVGPTAAIDHNLYIRDGFVYETNYTAGLRILDASEIADGVLTEVAYFDTHPADDATTFAGTWSNYAFFQSGIVVVSNIEDGLYVLKPRLGDDEPPPPPTGTGTATGGGWLANDDGQKINVGFDVEGTTDGASGELQLNDRAANVKIHISEVTAVGEVAGDCGGISAGDSSLEFHGDGTLNGTDASFRVCIEDNGDPGGDNDRFYLTCVTGCGYNSASRAPDIVLDGGNLDVQKEASNETPATPTTLILDPVLLSEATPDLLQTFTVRVYDQNQAILGDAQVTLTQTAEDGSVTTETALTDLTGMATFSLVTLDQPAEYVATAGEVESNAIELRSID